jgi:hypothetical protein
MGWLSFDDAEFCGQIYDLLKRLYRHSILEIGELDISKQYARIEKTVFLLAAD